MGNTQKKEERIETIITQFMQNMTGNKTKITGNGTMKDEMIQNYLSSMNLGILSPALFAFDQEADELRRIEEVFDQEKANCKLRFLPKKKLREQLKNFRISQVHNKHLPLTDKSKNQAYVSNKVFLNFNKFKQIKADYDRRKE